MLTSLTPYRWAKPAHTADSAYSHQGPVRSADSIQHTAVDPGAGRKEDRLSLKVIIIDRCYIALLSALSSTLTALMSPVFLNEWL